MGMASASARVQVLSRRMVKPPPRRHERIPLNSWDVSMLSGDYVQFGLLFVPPPFSAAHLVGHHLHAALADVLATYYPVAGRLLATDQHGGGGNSCCSVSIDCAGQGVELLHAVVVAAGCNVGDVAPPDAAVPSSFFPLNGSVNYDGRELPLVAVQVTELSDGGVFLGFAYNHALSDGTACWSGFFTAWAETARSRLSSPPRRTRAPPLFERWSPGPGAAAAAVLPFSEKELAELVERERRPALITPPLRERILHFSVESLTALKTRAREELLAAGDTAGAAAVTKFQAMASLLWRCITRARRAKAGDQEETTPVCCRIAVDNRDRLRPPLPAEYFGNAVNVVATEAVGASELLARGHGWAAAAVGRAAAAHTDAAIRARVAAWAARPTVSLLRLADANGTVLSSSPRFDVYGGGDFGWGRPLAVRSGGANKYDGKVTLFPGQEGGGSIDAEVALEPEHMVALEEDAELWAALTPDTHCQLPLPHRARASL